VPWFTFPFDTLATGDGLEEKLLEHCPFSQRIWFVCSRPWETDPGKTVETTLKNRFRAARNWKLAGVSVTLFQVGEETATAP
jgi:hypothetical protein